jgi:hypothetical protein
VSAIIPMAPSRPGFRVGTTSLRGMSSLLETPGGRMTQSSVFRKACEKRVDNGAAIRNR